MPTIKELREQKGWTQQDLAMRAGLTIPTISNAERSTRTPNRATLTVIAQALGVDVQALIEEYRQKNRPA